MIILRDNFKYFIYYGKFVKIIEKNLLHLFLQ